MTRIASQHLNLVPRLQVGVTGHRISGLVASGYDLGRLKDSVHETLMGIKQSFEEINAGRQHGLKVISPLAEGADRIVAEEGLRLGYQLESPLPFSREEYERDFATSESRHAFLYLLERASLVVELTGNRAEENESYEAVGRWVLDHSDLLLAIWNGKPAAGVGGTGQIVNEAIARRIPVLWIPFSAEPVLLSGTNPISTQPLDRLHGLVRDFASKTQ